MNVQWTANAIRQLSGIYEYISKDSEFYALRMVDRLTLRSILPYASNSDESGLPRCVAIGLACYLAT
jgi:hypothetical protein